jgi:hypothetical protein
MGRSAQHNTRPGAVHDRAWSERHEANRESGTERVSSRQPSYSISAGHHITYGVQMEAACVESVRPCTCTAMVVTTTMYRACGPPGGAYCATAAASIGVDIQKRLE